MHIEDPVHDCSGIQYNIVSMLQQQRLEAAVCTFSASDRIHLFASSAAHRYSACIGFVELDIEQHIDCDWTLNVKQS